MSGLWIADFALAAVILFLYSTIVPWRSLTDAFSRGRIGTDFFLYLVSSLIIAVWCFVVIGMRRRSKSYRIGTRTIVGITILMVLFYLTPDITPLVWNKSWVLTLMLVYSVMMLVGYFTLGGLLTILPAYQGRVVSKGLYGLVRHPIYSGSLHVSLIMTLAEPGIRNIGITVLLLIALWLRAVDEEEIIATEQARQLTGQSVEPAVRYEEYRKRVRRRFFHPWISWPLAIVVLDSVVRSWSS